MEKALEVACLLTARLKNLVGTYRIPVVVIVNHPAQEMLDAWTIERSDKFGSCARNSGLPTLDLWDAYAEVLKTGGPKQSRVYINPTAAIFP